MTSRVQTPASKNRRNGVQHFRDRKFWTPRSVPKKVTKQVIQHFRWGVGSMRPIFRPTFYTKFLQYIFHQQNCGSNFGGVFGGKRWCQGLENGGESMAGEEDLVPGRQPGMQLSTASPMLVCDVDPDLHESVQQGICGKSDENLVHRTRRVAFEITG